MKLHTIKSSKKFVNELESTQTSMFIIENTAYDFKVNDLVIFEYQENYIKEYKRVITDKGVYPEKVTDTRNVILPQIYQINKVITSEESRGINDGYAVISFNRLEVKK